jgi:hypothetical protein
MLFEFLLAARDCGQSALTRVPVSARHIDERTRQAGSSQFLGDLGGGLHIRVQYLYTRKPGRGRGGKPVEERDLLK